MKKMKIYIQRPWKASDSSYYKFLRESPPENVEYVNLEKPNLIQKKKSMKINTFVKQFIKKSIRRFYPSMPNYHFTPNAKRYDLIHCAHCLSRNRHPWVCHIEYAGQLWASGFFFKSKKRRVLKLLKSPYCKKIMTWTDWVKRDIVEGFPEIEHKIETVYPAISKQKFKKIKANSIRLLFISRNFYFKGGLYAAEVMNKLTNKYKNVEGIIISNVPDEVINKYSANKKIKFSEMIPQEKLFKEIYPSVDIFVYPSFNDTFGFPIIEAMSFGIPVVGSKRNSRDELIENGKTGFLVDTPFSDKMIPHYLKNLEENLLNGLVDKVEKLILNKKLRNRMSEDCLGLFEIGGKFSIKKRNLKLREIYIGASKKRNGER